MWAPVRHWKQTTERWWAWAAGTIILIIVGFSFWSMLTDQVFTQVLDGMNGIGILLGIVTPLLVWYLDKRRAWLDSLPLRMNVSFWCPSDEDEDGDVEWVRQYSAQGVFLAHEGDIRNWAQAIGTQVTQKPRLALDAYVHIVDWDPPPRRDENDGKQWFRLYEVHYPLRECPNGQQDKEKSGREPGQGPQPTMLRDEGDEATYVLDRDRVQRFIEATEAVR